MQADSNLGGAALQGRENASDLLLVQGIGGVAGLGGGNHEVSHDLAVEIRAQADGNEFVSGNALALSRVQGRRVQIIRQNQKGMQV